MKANIETVIGWAFPVLNLVIIALVASRCRFRGKPWLIAQLAVALAVMLAWRAPELLTGLDLMGSDARMQFYSRFGLPLNLIGLAGYGLLIPFVLAAAGSEPPAHAGSLAGGMRPPPMTVGEALFSFRGRMSRTDYWLKGFLFLLPVGIFNNVLAYGIDHDGARILAILIGLASLWPGFALLVKRLHDRNRSGWFAATLLIPFAGVIFAVWILAEVWFLRGTVGPNRFGADPVAADGAPQDAAPVGGPAMQPGHTSAS